MGASKRYLSDYLWVYAVIYGVDWWGKNRDGDGSTQSDDLR